MGDGARVDISTQWFWGDRQQLAFFDVRVFNPHVPSCSNSSLPSLYRQHEKRCAYQQRILEEKHGPSFPLFYCHSWYWASLNGDVQVTGRSPGRKAHWTVLEDPRIDSVCSELCPSSISHPVYFRCMLCHTQTWQIVQPQLTNRTRSQGRKNYLLLNTSLSHA